jgi:GAF domain-containing protein
MPTWIRKLIAGPVFEDAEKTRVAVLLNTILLTTLVISVLACLVLAAVATDPASVLFNLMFAAVITVVLVGLLVLAHRGHVRTVSLAYSFFMLAVVTAMMYAFGGIRNPGVSAYFVIITIAALLLGGRAAIIFGLLSALAALGIYYAEIKGAIIVPLSATVGLSNLFALFVVFSLVSLLLRFAVRSIAEGFERANRNAQDLAETNRELQASRHMLEVRTHDLARRASYLEATAEIARAAVSMLDQQELLQRVAVLVSEQFGFYHTGIFLLDTTGEWAELQAASSEGGRRMLARGHRLQVGQEGLVGYVTSRGQPRVALDVGADAVFFDNPDLPDTRSEMALPLQARGEIIGALDVQSREPRAFTDEDVAVLQTLADQVAIAISNARLFQQAERSLLAERRAYGELSRQAWAEMLRSRGGWGYRYEGANVTSLEGDWQVEASEDTAVIEVDIPLKIRDKMVGVLNFQKGADQPGSQSGAVGDHVPKASWTADETRLLERFVEQMGLALESARLHQDTRRRAAREVTARMGESLDVEQVLQTAVREIGASLGLHDLSIQLETDEDGA